MNNPITPSTYIRKLDFSTLRRLSDFLDPNDGWKDVIVSIRKRNGELRYTQLEVRRFESLAMQGGSPTIDLLTNWGTTNSTVGELVDILKSKMLLAPASVLLPEPVSVVLPQPATDCNLPISKEDGAQSWSFPLCPNPHLEGPEEIAEPDSTGYLSFSYHELMSITGNFDDRPTSEGGNFLGEGGFGSVYKGFVNHKPVAVKKLGPEGDIVAEELRLQFCQEVETLKTLKHPNLVDMVGFSCDGQYPCLVYIFMANGSVLDRLACMDNSPPLSWSSRCLIATGSARGLDYLHTNHHVHRDIKSGNILLDENFVAKISDFGLTRASSSNSSATMQTDRIVGTRAYMAPEALRGEITPKSDVFSFGVVLLEIISGLPPINENHDMPCLMDLRYEIDDEDLTLEDFLDKKMSDADIAQVKRTYSLASNCLEDRRVKRPTIKQVVAELEDVSRDCVAGASGTGI